MCSTRRTTLPMVSSSGLAATRRLPAVRTASSMDATSGLCLPTRRTEESTKRMSSAVFLAVSREPSTCRRQCGRAGTGQEGMDERRGGTDGKRRNTDTAPAMSLWSLYGGSSARTCRRLSRIMKSSICCSSEPSAGGLSARRALSTTAAMVVAPRRAALGSLPAAVAPGRPRGPNDDGDRSNKAVNTGRVGASRSSECDCLADFS